MIELYINDVKVDLTGSESILFNKMKSDYTNPTIMKNSFTKTITIPATSTNDDIFGRIWKSDRIIGSGSFNPSKRTPFKLFMGGKMIESGYVRMNRINITGIFREYEITLFGELGNILYNLSYGKDEYTKLTLNDLTYEQKLDFTINRNTILDAWSVLDEIDSIDSIYNTINFAITYDGVPDIEGFNAKRCIFDITPKYNSNIWYNDSTDRTLQATQFPMAMNDDGAVVALTAQDATYFQIPSTSTPGGALIECDRDMTSFEMKDFRSYMLRPVIRVKKIFEAISTYIKTNYGYELDMSDRFFNSDDFQQAWMTLSLMYERNPDIRSGSQVTQLDLLGNTNSPAEYLISYCKIYNIFIDIDIYEKKVILKPREAFYVDHTEKINIDWNEDVQINPLSFDKATYEFSFADSEAGSAKSYKDQYGYGYGSKLVNTGYEFDASTSKYIEDNVFRQGVDILESGPYYRYDDVPSPLMSIGQWQKYGLFKFNALDNVYDIMFCNIRMQTYESNKGYVTLSTDWSGMTPNTYRDAFPKLQCCDDSGKSVDSRNILVRFMGKYFPITAAYSSIDKILDTDDEFQIQAKSYFIQENIPNNPFHYCLTDDEFTGWLNGERCWIYASDNNSFWATILNDFPVFGRININQQWDGPKVNSFTKYFNNFNADNGSLQGSRNGLIYTNENSSLGGPYTQVSMTNGHRYFAVAVLNTTDMSQTNSTPYPTVTNSIIDSIGFNLSSSKWQVTCSYIKYNGPTQQQNFYIFKTSKVGSKVKITSFRIYDLTQLKLDGSITSAQLGLNYFGTPKGYDWNVEDTYDFSVSREVYVPYMRTFNTNDIYNKYWKTYISDVYSVDTRVLECTAVMDDYNDRFKYMFWYDDCLWVLTQVTDYDYTTKKCKAKFVKVNDKNNYII